MNTYTKIRCIVVYHLTLFFFFITTIYPTIIYDPDVEYQIYKKIYPSCKYETYLLVRKYSKIYNINVAILLSLIKEESNFNPKAVSCTGAIGLMQVMPIHVVSTGENLFDEDVNIRYGTRYFATCLKVAKGDYAEAVRMYNAGIYSNRATYKNWAYVRRFESNLQKDLKEYEKVFWSIR